jgi:hypothetical protein
MKRWMDEESAFKNRIENRMERGFAEVKSDIALVAGLQRDANGKTAAHAASILLLQREIQAIRSEDQRIEAAVSSIKEDGCSQLADHTRVLAGFNEEDREKAKGWVHGLSRPQKTAALGGITALLLPTVVDLVKIGYDALRWFESLHHTITK